MFDHINYTDFSKTISENTSTFICGNGFSINFDKRYTASKLTSALYSTHYHLKSFQHYDVVARKDYMDMMRANEKSTRSVLNKINTPKSFIALFDDAAIFAHEIINNPNVIEWINKNDYNIALSFGLQPLDLVRAIASQSDMYGAINVNYEYWTVLIYYVLALKEIPEEIYILNIKNSFVKAVLAGNTVHLNISPNSNNSTNLFFDVTTNGMYVYLRLLFSCNILLNGDSINVDKLEKWNTYNIEILNDFLSNFDFLMTTNYDFLLEKITQRNIYHLHGCFSKEKRRVLYESLGVTYNGTYYDLSTIIIGDYFLSKSFFQITAKNASTNFVNSPIMIYSDMIKETICNGQSNVVVIFGLGIDNDYHILRDIQVELEAANVESPQIIYCYYNEQDKEKFIESYKKCITYSEELSEYVINEISVSLIDSNEIINNIFISK